MKNFLLLYSWFVSLLLSWLPDAPLTMRLRGFVYSFALNDCGKNFQVASRVIIRGLANLRIGDNVYIGPNSFINCHELIEIHDEVLIGPNCVITSGNHSNHNKSFRFSKSITAPISIGKGSWIAANCTIIAGVSIKNNVLIAANSCVTKSTTESSIYGGVPAKFIKKLNDKTI